MLREKVGAGASRYPKRYTQYQRQEIEINLESKNIKILNKTESHRSLAPIPHFNDEETNVQEKLKN